MNIELTTEQKALQQQVREYMKTIMTPELIEEMKVDDLKEGGGPEFRKQYARMGADGWIGLSWSKALGGKELSHVEQYIFTDEVIRSGFAYPFLTTEAVAPVIAANAIEEVQQEVVGGVKRGEVTIAIGYSEPNAGTDLASLRTKAERDGDDWVINGQKIWTSGAHYSDYGILLTRTDPTVPKHKGLTMFFLDMKSPGVEIRPIKQASGASDFNEVYFTDVRIPDSQRLGNVNDGWNVSLTTLMNERMSIGAGVATGFPELFDFCNSLMLEDGPAIENRAVRSKLANWAVKASGLKYTSYRAISALSKGERPGPENSIGKLVSGLMLQDIATYAMDLEGAAGSLTGTDEEQANGQFQQMLLSSPSMRIAGGTDEILRNIIAERVLGLPGDIRVDKDVPYNKIPTKGR